jgi:hypothetical protein
VRTDVTSTWGSPLTFHIHWRLFYEKGLRWLQTSISRLWWIYMFSENLRSSPKFANEPKKKRKKGTCIQVQNSGWDKKHIRRFHVVNPCVRFVKYTEFLWTALNAEHSIQIKCKKDILGVGSRTWGTHCIRNLKKRQWSITVQCSLLILSLNMKSCMFWPSVHN